MFLIKNTINQRGLRFNIMQFTKLSSNKNFLFFKKTSIYHHNWYQRKFFKKKLTSIAFNYSFCFFKGFFYCINIYKSFDRYIGMFRNTQGIFKILPLLDCIALGNKINFYRNVLRFIYFMYVGSIMQLKFYKLFFLISNVGISLPKFSKAQGTYSLILKKKNNLVLIKLPSKQLIWISNLYYGMLGRNAGVFKYKEYLGKASINYFHKSIIVRSVAKNPIDHPNGGRTRGKMLFKTPWGLVAKCNK